MISIKSNYDGNGACIKCPNCKSRNINQKVLDTIEGNVCEYQEYCGDCQKVVGYWAYGSNDPSFKLNDPSLQMFFYRVRMYVLDLIKRKKDYDPY